MIAGISHMASAFSALRVSEAARAREESLQQQVATGRRVNSAKDDGAAWIAGLRARADAQAWGAVESRLGVVRVFVDTAVDYSSRRSEKLNALYESALAATEANLSTTERAARMESHKALYEDFIGSGLGADSRLINTAGGVWTPMGVNSSTSNLSILGDITGAAISHAVTSFAKGNPALEDVSTESIAALTLADTAVYRADMQRRLGDVAALLKGLESAESRANQMRGLSERAVDAATGADMGKVSTDLDAARTRASVASEGIARAIQIYGRAQSAVLDSALQGWSRVRAFA
jgi:flagellin